MCVHFGSGINSGLSECLGVWFLTPYKYLSKEASTPNGNEGFVVTEGNGGFESALESRNTIENDSGMKSRSKECSECGVIKEILYRCKYQNLDWRFLCEPCRHTIKDQYPESYSYGGTWKSKKK